MKTTKILVLLTMLLLTCTIAQAKEADSSVPTIRTLGNAHITVTPDRAVVMIGVLNTGQDAKDVQENNARLSNSVIENIGLLGVSKEKMRTSQFGIYPIYNDQDKDRKNEITGYRANNIISIILDDTSLVGTVIDTALKSGANEVNGIYYQKRDEQKCKQEALQAAVKESSAKAEAIAQALGKRLGRVVSVEDNGVSIQAPEMQRYYTKALATTDNSFLPGSMDVTASVTVIFEID